MGIMENGLETTKVLGLRGSLLVGKEKVHGGGFQPSSAR